MRNDAILIGYSGHALVLADILTNQGYTIAGYCESLVRSNNPLNISYLGDERSERVMNNLADKDVFISIGNNIIRNDVYSYLMQYNVIMPCLSHSSAILSSYSQLGQSTIVMPGVVVNSMVKIGSGVILNTSSVVEHECTISDFVHVAPGAVLAGGVSVGRLSFIGANSVIREGIKIGSNVIIGAGSVVVNDLRDGEIVYGNPAKAKKI